MDAVNEYCHRAKFQRGSIAAHGWVAGLFLLWMVGVSEQSAAKEHSLATPSPEAAKATASTTLLEGTIAVLDLTAPTPSLTLTTTEGKTAVLPIDPQLSPVWSTTQLDQLKIDRLKVGQRVKVHYGKKGEKQLADAILILEEPPNVIPTEKIMPVTPVEPATPVAPKSPVSRASKKAKFH